MDGLPPLVTHIVLTHWTTRAPLDRKLRPHSGPLDSESLSDAVLHAVLAWNLETFILLKGSHQEPSSPFEAVGEPSNFQVDVVADRSREAAICSDPLGLCSSLPRRPCQHVHFTTSSNNSQQIQFSGYSCKVATASARLKSFMRVCR